MPASKGQRQSWEYASGPTVGEDIPITSTPRDEEAPAVPSPPTTPTPPASPNPPATGSPPAQRSEDGGTEEREVTVAEPELSEETNQRLTDELREVVGANSVRVPRDWPRPSRGERPEAQGLGFGLNVHRHVILRSFAIFVTFGAIISLITNDWWLLPIAAGAHALGTMFVLLMTVRMTTVTEHPSPTTAAALAEEGVRNPDEHFSLLVKEFSGEEDRGTADVIGPGANERTVASREEPARATAQQSSAMTPTAEPSKPGGEGGAADFLIWSTVAALFVLSIAIPPVTGGSYMWLLTAVMVPLLIGWVVLQRQMIARPGQVKPQGRGTLIAIVACTAAAVAIFCAVVAFAFQH